MNNLQTIINQDYQEEMERAVMDASVKAFFLCVEMFHQATLVTARAKLVKMAKRGGFYTWNSEEIIESGEWLLLLLFQNAQNNQVLHCKNARLDLLKYTLQSYEQVLLTMNVDQKYIGILKEQIARFDD